MGGPKGVVLLIIPPCETYGNDERLQYASGHSMLTSGYARERVA
jgi:hypothetical protein